MSVDRKEEIRVIDSGVEILIVSGGNTDAKYYLKSKSKWEVEGKQILFKYDGDLVYTLSSSNFSTPEEASVVDLLILLNTMIINGPGVSGGIVTIEKSVDYDAVANDFVLMTTGATDKTVTLPASPAKDDIIGVSKRDSDSGNIIIDGNGNNINGDPTDIIQYKNTAWTYQFSGNEWIKK